MAAPGGERGAYRVDSDTLVTAAKSFVFVTSVFNCSTVVLTAWRLSIMQYSALFNCIYCIFSLLCFTHTNFLVYLYRRSVAVLGRGRGAGARPLTFCPGPQFFHGLFIIAPPPFGARGPGPQNVLARTATAAVSEIMTKSSKVSVLHRFNALVP